VAGFRYLITKRTFDLAVASAGITTLAMPMLAIAAVIRLTSKGAAVHWSRRIGKDNREFRMPKFRSMRVDTPQLPTHLMMTADRYLTPVGRFLRKTSLDELPQLYSILRGDMTLVGPRPALFNQDDLVRMRTECGVHRLVPGLTGWAQVNGRDDLPIPIKVQHDRYYLEHQSLSLDLKILIRTAVHAVKSEGVHH